MAHLILLLNGITDLALDDLREKTPLEVAKHPHLDALTHHSSVLSLSPPSPPSFENSMLNLLGCSPSLGSQAIFESVALGHEFKENEGAISCRFVSSGKGVITDTSDNLLTDREGALFCKSLNERCKDLGFQFYHISGAKALIITTHPAFLSILPFQKISPVSTIGKHWKDALPKSQVPYLGTLEELTSLFHSVIEDSEVNSLKADFEEAPVNSIIFTEGGLWNIEKPKVSDKLPSSSIIVTPNPATAGLAKAYNIDAWALPTEEEKFSHIPLVFHYLNEMLSERELVIWDVRYLWNSTYNGTLLEKVKTIEFLDKNLLAPLKKMLDQDKHSLSIFPLAHSSIHLGQPLQGPVPGIIYPKGQVPHFDRSFNERLINDEGASQIDMSALLNTLPLSQTI